MKIKKKSSSKTKSKLSFVNRLNRSKARAEAEIAESEKIEAQKDFNTHFVTEYHDSFRLPITKEYLPLIDYMRSSKVNHNNRAKNPDNIERIRRCLVAGEWYPDAVYIKISKEGFLMNGQHTLDAIFQFLTDAKTPDDVEFELGFFVGCNEDAMPYLDTQKRRSPEQNLKIEKTLLNRTQRDIVIIEGKRSVHKGKPFSRSGQVNFFEYRKVIEENKSILEDVFKDRVLSNDFPHRAIGYALFLLAKENKELAQSIMEEITEFYNKKEKGESSFASTKVMDKEIGEKVIKFLPKEHEFVELFREEKHKKMTKMASKTDRDCYRQEEFFPVACDWLVSNHNIDRKVFGL